MQAKYFVDEYALDELISTAIPSIKKALYF